MRKRFVGALAEGLFAGHRGECGRGHLPRGPENQDTGCQTPPRGSWGAQRTDGSWRWVGLCVWTLPVRVAFAEKSAREQGREDTLAFNDLEDLRLRRTLGSLPPSPRTENSLPANSNREPYGERHSGKQSSSLAKFTRCKNTTELSVLASY